MKLIVHILIVILIVSATTQARKSNKKDSVSSTTTQARVSNRTDSTISPTTQADSSITLSDFNAVFAAVNDTIVEANFLALQFALNSFNASMSFETVSQKAAFLGTILFNTNNLNAHEAQCAVTNSCDTALYTTTCATSTTPVGKVYFPRGAMMTTFACNYAVVNEYIKATSVEDSFEDVVENPELLSSDLRYSYLSALAVWMSLNSQEESCLTLTRDNLSNFPACLMKVNSWECTPAGYSDQSKHIMSIVGASNSLGSPLDSQTLSAMVCTSPTATDSSSQTTKTKFASSSSTAASTSTSLKSKVQSRSFSVNKPRPSSTAPVQNQTAACPCATANPVVTSAATAAATAAPTTEPMSCSTSTAAKNMACGVISESTFMSMFAEAGNTSLVLSNFNALSNACTAAGILHMDISQASVLLASISMNTLNLTQVDASSSDCNVDTPRGIMMMAGAAAYESFYEFTSSLGLSYSSFTSSPQQISNDLFLSYLSGLFVMTTTDSSGNSAMSFASAGMFSESYSHMSTYTTMTESSTQFLAMVQCVSEIMVNGGITGFNNQSYIPTLRPARDTPIENGARGLTSPSFGVQFALAVFIMALTM